MKKQLFAALLLHWVFFAQSQTFVPPTYAEINDNYRNHVNNVFGVLEYNRVTTGLLVDYGVNFADPKTYNGSVLHDSTLIENTVFSNLYLALFTSRFNNSISMRHPSIHDSLFDVERQAEVITLSGLLFRYNSIDPNANTNGKLDVVNGQLKDKYVNGIWQNPYQEFTSLAITPSINYYELSYGAVRLPSNLWLSNMGADVNSIQFDAGDGQGYRTVTMDNNIPFNYADTGWKHWVFRVNLVGGQQLYTHTKVHITNTSNLAGSGGGNLAQRGTALRKKTITATKAYNGVFGSASIIISYRNDNDTVIRKPLIVAEGLDIGHITKPENPEGANTYEEFIERIRNSESNNLRQLLFNGVTSEYDLIYVNWTNGTDYLQRNAYVLEAVIKWVNDRKQPLPGNTVPEKNVVMGLSMGGVVARMALGDLERYGPYPHDTRLYVSVDGPQQGSHIPLGLQAAARHALKMYVRTGYYALIADAVVPVVANGLSISKALRIADRPGPKQLLKQWMNVDYNYDVTTHEQFLQELRTNWAYPTSTRNIVVSNGSECAVDQEFAAGGNLLYLDRNIKTRFLGDIVLMIASPFATVLSGGLIPVTPFIINGSQEFNAKFDIKALATGGGNQVYYGKVKYTKKILWLLPVTIDIGEKTYNAPSGIPAFDNYPGSFYTLSMKKELNAASKDWMFTYDNTFQVQRRFTHVLTTSALDIGGGATALTNTQYYAKYVGENPPLTPYNIPFDNFTTAYNQTPLLVQGDLNPSTSQPAWQFTSNGSEYHTRFYLRNANWLAAELNGVTTVRANCSAFCNDVVNSWPSALCGTSSQIISVPNVGSVTSVSWSVIPSGILNLTSGANGTATITPVGQGVVTVTATITGDPINACGTRVFSKQIIVGTPIPEGINGPDHDLCYNGRTSEIGQFHVYNPKAGLTYYWQIDGIGAGIGTTISVNAFTWDVGNHQIRVRSYTSACGYSSWYTSSFVVVDCSSRRFSISPNPSSSTINIEAQSENKIQEVRIKDKLGNIKIYQKKISNVKKVLIDISGLQPDMYIVEIFDGQKWQTEKILKQ